MSKKLTTEEFIKKAKKVHGDRYDYSKVEYIDSKTNVLIICKKHGEFQQIASSHYEGQGCRRCAVERITASQTLTTEEFIKRARKIHGNRYDYSQVIYTGLKYEVNIICSIHGIFAQKSGCHLMGHGCRQCNCAFLDTELFIQRSSDVHNNYYDYSLVNYINSKNEVIIICPKHGQFRQLPHVHLGGSGCEICGRAKPKVSKEQFINVSNKIHKNKYDYSLVNYVNLSTPVDIICPYHDVFSQLPCVHMSGKECKKCGFVKIAKSKTKNINEFIEDARRVHGDKYDYSKAIYMGNKKKLEIICPHHGSFWKSPNKHLQGQGCGECLKVTTNDFIEKAKKVHGETYIYDNVVYVNSYTEVEIICRQHGSFYQKPKNHIWGSGCSRCINHISNACTKWLDSLGVEEREIYIRATSGHRYHVDGYDAQTNTVYEYFGVFWHGHPDYFDPNDVNPVTKTTYGELYQKTMDRIANLETDGYNVIYKWEELNNKKRNS